MAGNARLARVFGVRRVFRRARSAPRRGGPGTTAECYASCPGVTVECYASYHGVTEYVTRQEQHAVIPAQAGIHGVR